jgi:hypothetical protein
MVCMDSPTPHPRDAFRAWWSEAGPSLSEATPESSARAAWDAAVRAAWVILAEQVDRLVRIGEYPAAASARDTRDNVEALFASPGQWGLEQYLAERSLESNRQFFRRLTDEQLEKLRQAPRQPGTPLARALEDVLRERRSGSTGADPTDAS